MPLYVPCMYIIGKMLFTRTDQFMYSLHFKLEIISKMNTSWFWASCWMIDSTWVHAQRQCWTNRRCGWYRFPMGAVNIGWTTDVDDRFQWVPNVGRTTTAVDDRFQLMMDELNGCPTFNKPPPWMIIHSSSCSPRWMSSAQCWNRRHGW
jgi:hypothetical protein